LTRTGAPAGSATRMRILVVNSRPGGCTSPVARARPPLPAPDLRVSTCTSGLFVSFSDRTYQDLRSTTRPKEPNETQRSCSPRSRHTRESLPHRRFPGRGGPRRLQGAAIHRCGELTTRINAGDIPVMAPAGRVRTRTGVPGSGRCDADRNPVRWVWHQPEPGHRMAPRNATRAAYPRFPYASAGHKDAVRVRTGLMGESMPCAAGPCSGVPVADRLSPLGREKVSRPVERRGPGKVS
jgi:hypothetical protein